MTSHNRRNNDHSKFTSKTPRFFKVILEEALQNGKLGIPRKFVRNYGNQLPSNVELEVPSGEIWKVKLTKCDEGVWLHKGWQKFAEHYSLEFGYFVVFRYDGNGRFHVLIFDKSASEIEYPNTSVKHHCDVDVSLCKKSKEKPNLACPRPLKMIRINSPHRPCSKGKLDDMKGVGGITARTRTSVKTEVLSCVQNLTATEKAHAIHIASAFKCTANPVFMVVIQTSFVSNRFRLRIPWNFARKFLTMQNGDLTLCKSSGKTWPAKYLRSENGSCIHGGWRAFAEDNNLVAGDICVFELIKLPEILLKVAIYPVVENARKSCRPPADKIKLGNLKKVEKSHCSTGVQLDAMQRVVGLLKAPTSAQTDVLRCVQKLSASEKAHAVEIASAFKWSGNPVFMVVMQPSFVSNTYRMVIPSNFARKFLTKNANLMLCDSSGKTWPARHVRSRNEKRIHHMQDGWRAFAEDNNLSVGDICVFELIKQPESQTLLKVVIYPVVKNASKPACRQRQMSLYNGSIASRVILNRKSKQISECPSSTYRECKIQSK